MAETPGMARRRLHHVEAIALEIPLARNFGGSTYAVLKRSTVVTRLHTDDGLVSEVYNGDNREQGREIVRLIREDLAPRVIGQDLSAGEVIWQRMFALTHQSRDRKTLMEAIACVDCAIWDLVGKARGQSVAALLGGRRRERLPIISIGGYYREGKTLADIGREMESYREAGMAGCKFKVGGLTPEEDARRVDAPAAPPVRISSSPSTPTAASRWRTPCASPVSSSRSTSRGSRSRATGTTTPA
jgi:L-alanine-DL-glutamate epimerase-like enolase superfamily enzyme